MSSSVCKVSEAQERHMQTVLVGHFLRSPNAGVYVEVNGGCRGIWGHNASIKEGGPPEVVLLSEDSTPQGWRIRPDALSEFERAAKRLIQDGVMFFTVLRPSWALPALRWTLECR